MTIICKNHFTNELLMNENSPLNYCEENVDFSQVRQCSF